MKAAGALLLGFAAFLATLGPPGAPKTGRSCPPPQPAADAHQVRRIAGNLTAVANDLQAASSQDDSRARYSVGNLWIEVGRLKREGQNVRQIEWHVSELEESLRGGQQDDVRRRHTLNNLNYEIEAFNRRLRR